jgi:hypothetical protein
MDKFFIWKITKIYTSYGRVFLLVGDSIMLEKIFLVFILFAVTPAFAVSQPAGQNCSTLLQEATIFFEEMNLLFGVKQTVSFVSQIDIHDSEGNKTGTRGPTLADAQMIFSDDSENRVLMPHPCEVTDFTNPPKSLYLFILAHEFSHGIADYPQPSSLNCGNEYYKNFKENFTPEESVSLSIVHHINMDVLALKILGHFGLPQELALKFMKRWFDDFPETTGGVALRPQWDDRMQYLNSIIPTSFQHGQDILSGRFLSNFELFEQIAHKHFPASDLVSDLKFAFPHNTQNCRFPSDDQRKKSIETYSH